MESDAHRHRSRPHDAGSSSQQQRERDRNRERLSAQQKSIANNQNKVSTHGHQRPPIDPKLKTHTRPHSIGGYPVNNRAETRDILRETRNRHSVWQTRSIEIRLVNTQRKFCEMKAKTYRNVTTY